MYDYNRYNHKLGYTELKLNQSDLIVTKTDLKGIITYANPTFLDITGYYTSELVGKNHNIIRHADMPRAIFTFMWSELQSGRSVYAYIKNLAKDGSFYWTFAYVAPDYSSKGEIIGYHSERRAPNPKAIQDITIFYNRIKQTEMQNDVKSGVKLLLNVAINKSGSYEKYIYTLQNQD